MYYDWQITLANDWQVGNWAWTAIDYLGESGLGKTPVDTAGMAATVENQTVEPGWRAADTLYKSYGGYGYGYRWFQSNCGDLDLIGERKPQNLWRSAIQGTEPVSIVVARPTPAGDEQEAVWWGYFDEQESWNWDVPDGQPMTVRVYTTGEQGGASSSTASRSTASNRPPRARRGPNSPSPTTPESSRRSPA